MEFLEISLVLVLKAVLQEGETSNKLFNKQPQLVLLKFMRSS